MQSDGEAMVKRCGVGGHGTTARHAHCPALSFARRTLSIAALATFLALAASAQNADDGALDGRLTDLHGKPLANATIVLQSLDSKATATTNRNGVYRITGLAPGDYRLEATLDTLGHGQVEDILITAGHTTHMQAALDIAVSTRRQLADSTDDGLDPITPAITTTLDSAQIQQLPAREHDWVAIAATTPAATVNQVPAPDNSLSGSLEEDSANQTVAIGGSPRQASTTVDGIRTPVGFSRGGNNQGRTEQTLGESAVMNLSARTGLAGADQSHGDGGAIGIETQHGRNGLHGQFFFNTRRSQWGALNPFTQQITLAAPTTATTIAQYTPVNYSPPYSREAVGIGAGRQILRNRLWDYTAFDGLWRNDPAMATVRQPENFYLQPANKELAILGARLGISGSTLFEQEVAAYSNYLSQFTGLLGQVPRTATQLQGFTRLDWQITERQHLDLEVNLADFNSPSGALGSTIETYGSHSFGDMRRKSGWVIAQHQKFFTENLLNVLGGQWNRHILSVTPSTPSTLESTLMASASGQLPEMMADSRYGFILGAPARLVGTRYPDEQSFLGIDTLSWVRGHHLLKLGASFDHIADTTNGVYNQNGVYDYASIVNFISDVASFQKYGLNGVDNPYQNQHNCDASGKSLGYLPCYTWFKQQIGPNLWSVSTNDLAAFVTEQWQPVHALTLSIGGRMEAEQLPPPIASVNNSDLAQTQKLPPTEYNWEPRFGMAWAPFSSTVLRAGAGLYYGRIDNSAALGALTQTGSSASDLQFFFKPTDQGAPPFPYTFPTQPQTAVKPGAVFFASNFHLQEVDQAVVSLGQQLPGNWQIEISALASLGRRLPVSIDTNIDPTQSPQTVTYGVVDGLGAGPIKTAQITVPFYSARLNPNYQQIDSIESRSNSKYDGAMIKVMRYGRNGLSLRAHYLYAHATDWNPNETGYVQVNGVLDPTNFGLEYGTSGLDIRHSAMAMLLYESHWRGADWARYAFANWSFSAVGQFRSGLPYTMRVGGYIPGFYSTTRALIEGVGPGLNGSGGDNRLYSVGRNTYRYPETYTADVRLGKRFFLGGDRELEFLAESFNLFNHENVTWIESTGYYISRGSTTGGLPTLNFLTGLTTNTVEFGKPLNINGSNYFRPRELQLGVRARF